MTDKDKKESKPQASKQPEEQKKGAEKPEQGEKKNFRHLVRVMNTDLRGEKHIVYALTRIRGVGVMLANAVCRKAKVPLTKKAGYLSASEVKALEEIISAPVSSGIPLWMLNRRRDYESGEDKHLLMGSLDFTERMDVKRLKKIKSVRGLRHQWGLPVRGQKTKCNFRRNKGKSALGVQKKKVKSGKV